MLFTKNERVRITETCWRGGTGIILEVDENAPKPPDPDYDVDDGEYYIAIDNSLEAIWFWESEITKL